MTISLIIPCYNEEKAIPAVLSQVQQLGERFKCAGHTLEVIVVDDRSLDNSLKILSGYKDIKVISNSTNLGYGGSLKKGFSVAGGDFIAFMDMDDTYQIGDLEEMIAQANHHRVVIGERFTKGQGFDFVRRSGNIIYSKIIQLHKGAKVMDPCSGFRVFHRELVTDFVELSNNDLSYSLEMTLHLIKKNISFVEHAIRYETRVGQSKLNVLTDGLRFLWTIIRPSSL